MNRGRMHVLGKDGTGSGSWKQLLTGRQKEATQEAGADRQG